MGDYLEHTSGSLATSRMSEDEKSVTAKLKCENDAAERSFAVLRAMHKKFPSMTLLGLAGISLARENGTFKMSGDVGENGGIAHTSDPKLVRVVHELTSIRRHTMGAVSDMLRRFHKGDLNKSAENRKKKRKEKEALSLRRAAKRAAKANDSLEVVLCATMEEVRNKLAACGNRITAKKAFLKGQVNKRLMTSKQHGVEYPMSADWDQFRSASTRKIVVTAKEKGTEAEYPLEPVGCFDGARCDAARAQNFCSR